MPTTQFRACLTILALSPAERLAVSKRRRFYSMAWLRRSDDPDDDLLP